MQVSPTDIRNGVDNSFYFRKVKRIFNEEKKKSRVRNNWMRGVSAKIYLKHLFETEIFCNIINVSTVDF